MPDESQPPEEPNPPCEPTRMADSDHPSGDTWRLQQTPTRTAGGVPPGGAAPPVEVIGDFEVVGKLGQGGMGTVYRARQLSLDRLVALKILPARLEADAEYVARFQREARVAASLKHANLVRVYTSGAATGCHYIAMELIEGETLADWLKRGPVPPSQAVRMVLAVAQALECGWRTAQLIHRDIKPGNIFLSHEGAVKLGDLGLAKTTGSDTTGLTQTGAMMGTPHYISPEQARGDRDLDFRADIYSLGCTLYQMLTGQTPYAGRDPFAVMNMHVNAPPPAILKVLPQCPIPLARLVSKMLKKQRRERHASYDELIAQLESVQALLDLARAAPVVPVVAPSASPREAGVAGLMPQAPGAEAEATPQGARLVGRRSSPPGGQDGRPTKLYAGIAAGVLVFGIAGYFLWPKEEKLTAAQRWARDHAGDKKPEVESPPAGGTRAVASAGRAAAGGWQPLFTDAEWHDSGSGREFQDGLMHVHGWYGKPMSWQDGAIRARVQVRQGIKSVNLLIRECAGGHYEFGVSGGTLNSAVITLFNRATGKAQVLSEGKAAAGVKRGDVVMLELRVQGDHLTGLVNGVVVAEAHDDQLKSGPWGIDSPDAWYESVEVQPLPAPAGTVNLLSLVDVKRDATVGTWSMTPEGLGIQHDGKVDRLEFNYVPPAEYDFATEFTIQEGGSGDVTQILALSDRGIIWRMLPPACFGERLDGLEPKDPKRTEGVARSMGRLKVGQRYRSVVEVRANSLRALLDGVEVLKFTGDLKRISSDDGFSLRDARHLGLASYNNTDILFHKAEVWPAGASVGAAPAAVASAAPAAKFSPSSEPWVDALADPAAIVLNNRAKRTADGLALGVGICGVTIKPLQGPDSAVRMILQMGNKVQAPWLYLRHTRGPGFNTGYYIALWHSSDSVVIGKYEADKFQELKKLPVKTIAPGEMHELEGRVMGNRITVKLDGVEVGFVEDDSIREGGATIEGNSSAGEIYSIRGVQYLDLSSPAKTAGGDPR